MIKSLSLLILFSLLVNTLTDTVTSTSGPSRHHRPDTDVNMDLKPAYVRPTKAPHPNHLHDFSLPMPSGGNWNKDYQESHTEAYDYEEDKDIPFRMESGESGDYDEKHNHRRNNVDEDLDDYDSFNDQFASSATTMFTTTFLLVTGALLLIT